MGTVSIRAGMLRRDQEYFGAKTAVPGEIFFVERMVALRVGWLEPYSDSGLGSSSQTMNFVQGTHSADAKIGADFYYMVNDSTKVRYFITCNSAQLTAALESTDAHNFVDLPVATSSGYTIL